MHGLVTRPILPAMAGSLPLRTKLGYGVGDLGGNLFFTIMGFWLLNFVTDNLGLAASLAGLALLIGRAWGRGHRPAHGHAVRPHGVALGAAAALPAVRLGGDGGRDDAGVPGGWRARLEHRRPVCLGGVRGLRGEHRLYRGFHTLRGAHPGVGARLSGAHQPQRLPHGVGDRRHPARGGSVHHRGGSGGRRRGGSGVHGRRSAVRGDLRGGGADHLRLGARASGDPGPRAGRQRVRRLRGGAEGAPVPPGAVSVGAVHDRHRGRHQRGAVLLRAPVRASRAGQLRLPGPAAGRVRGDPRLGVAVRAARQAHRLQRRHGAVRRGAAGRLPVRPPRPDRAVRADGAGRGRIGPPTT